MNKLEEFWYCVAPQEDLPLYKGQEISSGACENLINFIDLYKSMKSQTHPEKTIQEIILQKPGLISDIRVLVGVSDKRLYLDLTYIANIYTDSNKRRLVSEEREHLLKHDTRFFISQLSISPMKDILASEITKYFINKGLLEILNTFTSLSKEQIIPIFNNLIAPKEIQQKQAKYRGHGAEQAFAKVVTACGCSITPEHKDTDPMAGYDPNVDLASMVVVNRDTSNENCHSFDLIINDRSGNIRVLIQSLIHSSDPGQYGVNKSDETKDIYKRINVYNKNKTENNKVYLLGSVDGVGFSENPNGTIVKMIDAFDDFFQMNTLFKIPLFLQKIGMIDNVEGISFDKSYFEEKAICHFTINYLEPLGIQNMSGAKLDGKNTLQAGKAVVIFK